MTEEEENGVLAAIAAFSTAFPDARGRLRRVSTEALETALNGVLGDSAAKLSRRNPEINHFTLADLPDYLPEEQNPDILVKGRWLERGGSAFIVSTAGTGKSIHAAQLMLCFTEGLPFSGLAPIRPCRFWYFQTEDTPSRLTIDREDITAELAEEYPSVNWRETWRKIHFFSYPGKVGVDFLDMLDMHLSSTPEAEKPDIIVLNPFFAFIGGAITDSAYVTPFLRGGTIGREKTCGLQYILDRYHVGILCYHHTPKPPTSKEIDAWMQSPFPEYQCAGSADITNWGRSFVTIMKCKDHPSRVVLTAGKNGAELGWQVVSGGSRYYLAWSEQQGITGRRRHAWRELEAQELAEMAQGNTTAETVADADTALLADCLKAEAMTYSQLLKGGRRGLTKRRFDEAWRNILKDPTAYGLATAEARTGRGLHIFYGTSEGVANAVKQCVEAYAKTPAGQPTSTNFHQLPPTSGSCKDDTATNFRKPHIDIFNISMGAKVGSSEGAKDGENENQLSDEAKVGQPPESMDDYYLDDPLI